MLPECSHKIVIPNGPYLLTEERLSSIDFHTTSHLIDCRAVVKGHFKDAILQTKNIVSMHFGNRKYRVHCSC